MFHMPHVRERTSTNSPASHNPVRISSSYAWVSGMKMGVRS